LFSDVVLHIHDQVVADYEAIRRQIRAGGVDSVTGDLGKLVQARTVRPRQQVARILCAPGFCRAHSESAEAGVNAASFSSGDCFGMKGWNLRLEVAEVHLRLCRTHFLRVLSENLCDLCGESFSSL